MNKLIIKGLDGFAEYIDKPLFTSPPIEITVERIQQYCLSVNNQEWVHWDIEASKESGLEGLITPGLYLPSLYPQVFWDHVKLNDVDHIIVKGIDGIRIFKPIYMGTLLTITSTITKVSKRSKGVEVIYQVSFDEYEDNDHLADATFILRYW
jgi:acyl dehydratase